MRLLDVTAAVLRYRERVRAQVQLARDIQHLGEVARMLFEDKPDKTKAVEAVNDIAVKRRARMDAEARALLDAAASMAGNGAFNDRGDLLSWLMLVNQPGQFPYTQGIAEAGASGTDMGTHPARSHTPIATDEAGLVNALAEGWSWLATAHDADDSIEARALQFAIAFDEHRDADHRALGRAARRLWAVSLREHFGINGDGLKLVLVRVSDTRAPTAANMEIDHRAIDQAEDALLTAVQSLVSSSEQG